jgi:hypothetical protein
MSAFAIGGIVFACVFGGALLGIFLSTVLPKHHLSDDTKDVVRLAMATLATMAALVLGLLTASSKNSFDTKDNEIRHSAAQIVLLDRTLAEYGPETQEVRKLLREIVAMRIRSIWNEDDKFDVAVFRGVPASIEEIQRKLLAFSPANDTQRWLQSKALQIIGEITEARWLLTQQTDSSIQWQFLAILVFWLAIIFGSFGMFAPRNATVVGALFAGALSMAGSIYLIVEMDRPFSGSIKLSSAPLHYALDQLGR